MANVVKNIGNSIKSVIGRFLADDEYESESDIKTALLKASEDGEISPKDAIVLAEAFSDSNKGAVEYERNQGSSGKSPKKSPKKYTSHKDKEESQIHSKDKGRER